MRQLLILWMVGILWSADSSAADPAVSANQRIGLVNVGGFDEPLFGQIADHIAKQLLTTPKVLAPRDLVGADTIIAESSNLSTLVTGDVACVIGIAMLPDSIKQHGAVDPESRTAIVNANGLKPLVYDEEHFGRRLEKEVIRCAGILMGMKPCPNPRCALHQYRNEKGLDAKGRNFCPPCASRFRKIQAESNLNRRTQSSNGPPPVAPAPAG